LINLPVGVIALYLGQRVLPADEPESAGKLDIAGFVLAGLGTVLLIYGLSETASTGGLLGLSLRGRRPRRTGAAVSRSSTNRCAHPYPC